MTELMRQPHVMKELQDEIRGISSKKLMVFEGDLGKIKYLKAVTMEILRLNPQLPLQLRILAARNTNVQDNEPISKQVSST